MQAFQTSRRRALAVLAGAASVFAAPGLRAQGAGRPLTWLVGYPPGGTVDVLTRLVARELEPILRQTVVVDNRPGAAGVIAQHAAAQAVPDGSVLVTIPGPVVSNVPTPQVGREFAAVSMLARGPMVLVGTMAGSLPPTLQGLLDAARKDAKTFSYATSGNGSSQHLAGELLNQIAHTSIMHVPYKGGSQAVTDIVGGQVPLGMLGMTPVLPHIRSGRLRAYGVSTATRSALRPDVPTLQEAGAPGFDADQWFLVATAAGAPAERVRQLNAAIGEVLRKPQIVAAFAQAGAEPAVASPDEAAAFVQREAERWTALAKKARLTLD